MRLKFESIIDEKPNRKNKEKQDDVLLSVLADKYCRTLLASTLTKPKSAMELSAEHRIPISTVYRRLSDLHQLGLLDTSGTIGREGKKYFLYKSRIKAINAVFSSGILEIKLTPNKK